MLMHQGIGLDRFNALPERGAVHALFACCCSVTWARQVAAGRPYRAHTELLTAADTELFELSEADIDRALECHPGVARRAQSTASSLEQSACWAPDEATMSAVIDATARYEERFGHVYLWCAAGRDATELLGDLTHRLGNTPDTERKTMLGELAKINRSRIQRMLGPEGGFAESGY
ncbi:2-oxo-4-hydroxy-4-carboxy-5-ureidoimidazoline decarboxylase [Rhodococcus sp. NPDC058514]|uniref:2-oxo-4-hydroxy-4-carboxy-5-ureidoimidazoline decarboxylase n=1 Tax=unclassified Rhodococcus (in: high G+C Gram-positive bacteria) TaxID=192944 RepID=UPI00364B321E